MCYAKPGPRCSTHAKQILHQLNLKAYQAKQEGRYEDMYALTPAINIAEEEYDATPAGRKEIIDLIKDIEDAKYRIAQPGESSFSKMPKESQDKYLRLQRNISKLSERVYRGDSLAKTKMDAWRQLNSHRKNEDKDVITGEGHVDDYSEAAA